MVNDIQWNQIQLPCMHDIAIDSFYPHEVLQIFCEGHILPTHWLPHIHMKEYYILHIW